MAGITETGSQFSTGVGLIYVFNLIVGTGALTMSKAFSAAGWILSLFTVIILAFMSYLTVTFVTETMATANALLRTETYKKRSINEDIHVPEEVEETKPLVDKVEREERSISSPFEITQRVELGQMASIFFNKVGVLLFNICIVVYLYGDLAIYAAAVPVSIRDVACTYKLPHQNSTNTTNTTTGSCKKLSEDDPCWPGSSINRLNAYRIFVGVFFVTLGWFSFFNVQKTKYLQLITTASRWIAFSIMVVLAVIRLAKKEGQGQPGAFVISGVPNLFGVCVYSFMCHHSLPSLVTPIKDKSKLLKLLAADYVLILLFYALLSFTGIYAFKDLQDVYTLNFLPDECDSSKSITSVKFIQYFLALFPVFTLSTNFPIISITLRNNLKAIGYNPEKPYRWAVDKIVFPLLAIVPPMIVALITDKVEFLVGITGSYAGAGIQYVIPAFLVYCSRKQVDSLFTEPNIHSSPFKGKFWIFFVCIWAFVSIVFVTVNHIVEKQ